MASPPWGRFLSAPKMLAEEARGQPTEQARAEQDAGQDLAHHLGLTEPAEQLAQQVGPQPSAATAASSSAPRSVKVLAKHL